MRHNPTSTAIPIPFSIPFARMLLVPAIALLPWTSALMPGKAGSADLWAAPKKERSHAARTAEEEDSSAMGEASDNRKDESLRKRARAMDAKVDEIGQSWVQSFQNSSGPSKGKGAPVQDVRMHDPAPAGSTPQAGEGGGSTAATGSGNASGDPQSAAPSDGSVAAPSQAEKEAASRAAVQSYFNNDGNQDEAPSFLSVVFKFFGMMMVLIGVLYAMVRYMKRKTGLLPAGNDLVKVIASVPVIPGKTLQIVDLAGRLVVLGVSEAGVNLIMNVEDGMMADRIRLWQSERGGRSVAGEGGLLEQLTQRIRNNDLKFWNSEGEGRKERLFGDFRHLLRSQLSGRPADAPVADTGSEENEERRQPGERRMDIERMPPRKPQENGVGPDMQAADPSRTSDLSNSSQTDPSADDLFQRYFKDPLTPEEQLQQRLQSQRRRLSHLKDKKLN